jgi:hypothetical protein
MNTENMNMLTRCNFRQLSVNLRETASKEYFHLKLNSIEVKFSSEVSLQEQLDFLETKCLRPNEELAPNFFCTGSWRINFSDMNEIDLLVLVMLNKKRVGKT